VRRGDHAVANGPAGGNLLDLAWGCGVCASCTLVCGVCCGNASPCGPFNKLTGAARPTARRGAIGAVALQWLERYLRAPEAGGAGDAAGSAAEAGATLADHLHERPAIASGFACENVTMTRG
jgi:hypothetical protein